MLGSGAPHPPGVLSDFTLRTDNQAISWLCTKQDISRILARWLDEIEEFRFDPADPLTRRGFPDRYPCTARPDAAADPSPAPAAATGPPPTSAAAAVAIVLPTAAAGRPAGPGPPVLQDSFTALAGAHVRLATGTITVSPNPVQPEQLTLVASLTAVVTWWRLPRNARQATPSTFAAACSTAEGRGKRTGCVCLTGGEG